MSKHLVFRRVLPAVIALAALCLQREYSLADEMPLATTKDNAPIRALLLPDGVADYPAGKIGYVTNAENGIDAIDLVTGKLFWKTAESDKPLWADKNRLVAMKGDGNNIRILILDATKKGALISTSKPVVFPEWVSIQNSYGHSFSYETYFLKNALLLKWEAHAHYAGGAAPSEEILADAKKDAAGVARFDLKSGQVEMVAEDKIPVLMPAVPAALRDVHSEQYALGNAYGETKPFISRGVLGALELAQKENRPIVVLKRWDLASGKAMKPVQLLEGVQPVFQLSLDGRYIMAVESRPKDDVPANDYAIWIFSIKTAKQIAKLPVELVTSPASIIGTRLYSIVSENRNREFISGGFIIGRQLQATDLKTGAVIWQHPIEPERILPMPM